MLTAAGDTSVSATAEPRVRLWDAATGVMLKEFCDPEPCYPGVPQCPAFQANFSPDGSRIVTASTDSLRVWDAVGYETLLTSPLNASLDHLAFSPDGLRLLGLSQGSVRVWQAISRVQSDRP